MRNELLLIEMEGQVKAQSNTVSIDGLRLRWVIKDGCLASNTHALYDALNANSSQIPYQKASGDLHSVPVVSISTRPLQNLSVTLPDLDNVITYDECPEEHPNFEDTGIPSDEPTCNVTVSIQNSPL